MLVNKKNASHQITMPTVSVLTNNVQYCIMIDILCDVSLLSSPMHIEILSGILIILKQAHMTRRFKWFGYPLSG